MSSAAALERLTYAQRKDLPDGAFALPEKREGGKGGLPLTDKRGHLDPTHVRNAASRLAQMHKRGTVTPSQYAKARRKIIRAACATGVERTCAAQLGAMDNPLTGGETAFLVVGGLVAVGVIGGVVYVATRPAQAATPTTPTTPTTPVTTNTPPGAVTPDKVATTPSAMLEQGSTYVVGAFVAGLNPTTGAPLPGFVVPSEDQIVAFLGLSWANVFMIWWGPTSTLNDPQNLMSVPIIAQGKLPGVMIFTAEYTAATSGVPAGVAAFKVSV